MSYPTVVIRTEDDLEKLISILKSGSGCGYEMAKDSKVSAARVQMRMLELQKHRRVSMSGKVK